MTTKLYIYNILLQLCLVTLTSQQASVNKRSERFEASQSPKQSNETDCGFAGNSDIYGVGIRIGYYTQALSVWIANYFVLSEAKTLRSTNLLFMFAVLIGLFALSNKSPHVFAIEAFLLLQLSFATFYIGVVDWTRYSKKYWRFSPGRNTLMSITNLCAIGYNAWFWWTGLDKMNKTPCGTYAFFFTRVDLYGWYRAMYRALSVPAILGAISVEINRSVEVLQYLRNRNEDVKGFYDSLRDSLADALSPWPPDPQSSAARLQEPPLLQTSSNSGSEVRSQSDKIDAIDLATRTPLPPSPGLRCDNGAHSPSDHTISIHEEGCPSIDLACLAEAERYSQRVFDVSCAKHSAWHWDLYLPLVKIPLQIFIPSVHSPRTLQRRLKTFFAQRPFRMSVLVPILQHAKSLNKFPTYGLIVLFEKAVIAPEYKDVDPRALQAILDFELTKLPKNTFVWTMLYRASAALLIVIFLIVSIELCIVWNHIYGVASVSQVGQLIPAVIGTGGLVKVLWRWVTTRGVSIEEEDGVTKEVRECAEMYAQVKSALQHNNETLDV